jgi:hypothetical protein
MNNKKIKIKKKRSLVRQRPAEVKVAARPCLTSKIRNKTGRSFGLEFNSPGSPDLWGAPGRAQAVGSKSNFCQYSDFFHPMPHGTWQSTDRRGCGGGEGEGEGEGMRDVTH